LGSFVVIVSLAAGACIRSVTEKSRAWRPCLKVQATGHHFGIRQCLGSAAFTSKADGYQTMDVKSGQGNPTDTS
jgi:hypothetical protein